MDEEVGTFQIMHRDLELELGQGAQDARTGISVYAAAAAFYVACLKAGHIDEAQEFAEWFLESFDIDLES